jgi:hypothetical protein
MENNFVVGDSKWVKKVKIAKDHLKLSGLYRVMLILWKILEDTHCQML